MKPTRICTSLLALVTATLLGCGGGGSDGVVTRTAPLSTGTPAIATYGATELDALSTDAVSNLAISGSVQSVAINSPPVVTFQLVNSDNSTALVGLDQWSVKKSSDKVKAYTNFAFSIAKLVPGTNGSPSKWVSYMVASPTLDDSGAITGYTPGRPSSENNGTLAYVGNGQYQYTFRRNITAVSAQLASFTYSGNNRRADLDDVTYDPYAVHRLVIQVSGPTRGSRTSSTATSCNTADGTCQAGASYEFIRTPVDIVYDWIPATGRAVKVTDTDIEQREIVNVAACASCHNKFTFHGGDALKGYGGGRQETRQCVMCHTDQRKYGRADPAVDANGNFTSATYTIDGLRGVDGSGIRYNQSLLDMPVMIHKVHMGEELTRTGYDIAGVKPNEVKYPQLITNCAKCHSGDASKPDGTPNTVTKLDGTVVPMATVQGNNWHTKPSRVACGACHDGINFNTGTGKRLSGGSGHGGGGVGGPQADDSRCATCHESAGIKKAHVAVSPQNLTSTLFAGGTNANTHAAWLAANPNNLPAGAIRVSYDIKSVSRNADKRPVMVFRILQNGVRKDFNGAPSGKTDAELSNLEMWDNFMGAPSAYFVFAVPQDGIASPADFNANASGYLRSIWNGKATGTGAGTLSGPDADGYYTVTLTGVTIPDNAVMLTGGLGYSYNPVSTMPLTQTNLVDYPVKAATATSGLSAVMPNKTGGLIVVTPDVQVAGTGYSGRRQIVEDKRCNNCHQELGPFNASSFHAGQRNDGSTCAWCHNPNRTSSGWSADSTNFVHATHGAAKRSNRFTWHASSTTDGYWAIGYPGVLKNCEACHVPGSYDFSNSASKSAAGLSGGTDNRLFRYSATGTFKSQSVLLAATPSPTQAQIDAAALTVFAYSPFVIQDTNYGSGFSFNAGTGASTAANAATLLETPTATVCFSCHDDNTVVKTSMGKTAKQHMLDHGARLYAARGADPVLQTETCLSCHGPDSAANIKTAHSK